MVHILETRTDWLHVRTEGKIKELRNYLNTLIKQLDDISNDYENRVETDAQNIEDEEEREQYYEWSREEYWDYKETFPRILLNSFHVTSVTLLESELFSIASRIGKKQNQLFDVSEMKGNDYIQSARYYIKKLTQLDIKDSQTPQTWNKIMEGRRLRNIITHSNGILENSIEISLAKKCKVHDDSIFELLSIRPIHQIFITREYSKSFLTTLMKFFHELYNNIKAGNHL